MVPPDRWNAGLQLHLARMHGSHFGIVLLQVPAQHWIVTVLGRQSKLTLAIHGRSSPWSQRVCERRKLEADWRRINEGTYKVTDGTVYKRAFQFTASCCDCESSLGLCNMLCKHTGLWKNIHIWHLVFARVFYAHMSTILTIERLPQKNTHKKGLNSWHLKLIWFIYYFF